jgi:hypothetical protein
MFTLTIDTGNAVFADDPRPELARILESLAVRLPDANDSGTVRDSNGNTVGRWTFETDDACNSCGDILGDARYDIPGGPFCGSCAS